MPIEELPCISILWCSSDDDRGRYTQPRRRVPVCRGLGGDHLHGNVNVAVHCLGVRTDLVGRVHDGFRDILGEAW